MSDRMGGHTVRQFYANLHRPPDLFKETQCTVDLRICNRFGSLKQSFQNTQRVKESIYRQVVWSTMPRHKAHLNYTWRKQQSERFMYFGRTACNICCWNGHRLRSSVQIVRKQTFFWTQEGKRGTNVKYI